MTVLLHISHGEHSMIGVMPVLKRASQERGHITVSELCFLLCCQICMLLLLLLLLRCFSRVQLCVTPWTAAHQAPLSTGVSRQEYWSGLLFPSPDLHTHGQKAHKKALNVTNYQRNTNQNYSELSSHTSQNGRYPSKKKNL